MTGGRTHVVEAARQFRGAAGARQVPEARLAFVHGAGGILPPTACWCWRAHEPARRGGAMTEIGRPVPQPTPESQPYWGGCLRGELLYQHCASCRRAQFYPRSACASCGGAAVEWRRSEGRGTVHAVTVVHRPPSAAFKLDLPYAVALVDVDEGFRMMANVLSAGPEAVAIGDRVTVTFERRGEMALPQFQPCALPGEDL